MNCILYSFVCLLKMWQFPLSVVIRSFKDLTVMPGRTTVPNFICEIGLKIAQLSNVSNTCCYF